MRNRLFSSGDRFRPICIRRDALGVGVPHTDLRVSADHALVIDGLEINAGALVNGTTIYSEAAAALPERFTYYHIETAAHAVVLANGAPAETFIAYAERQHFDNYSDYAALYGPERAAPEMTMPRITSARHVPVAIRERLRGNVAA